MHFRVRSVVVALSILVLAALGAGCNLHVERPVLRPRAIAWQSVDASGLRFRVTIAAYNPNTFELPLRDLRARVTLDGIDAGSSVSNLAARLPPRREIDITADLAIPWGGLPATALTLITRQSLRYRLDGEVTVDHYLTVRTRFTQEGTMDRSIVLGPALNTVRGFVQGLFGSSGGQR